MNILAGTFRASFVAAAISAGYYAYDNWQQYNFEQSDDQLFRSAMECGARRDPALLEQRKNEHGKIDIGKLGCAPRQFFTTTQELNHVRAGTYPYKNRAVFKPFDPSGTAAYAFGAFVLVNLAGLAFVGARSVFRWVMAGFKGQ